MIYHAYLLSAQFLFQTVNFPSIHMPFVLSSVLSSTHSTWDSFTLADLKAYHLVVVISSALQSIFLQVEIPTSILVGWMAVFLTYGVVHRLFLWRYVFSPLRSVPGPALGHPLLGQIPTILMSESCIPKREWVKQYGPIVRIPGAFGTELLLFMKPEALQQILVKDWLDYPRVRLCAPLAYDPS